MYPLLNKPEVGWAFDKKIFIKENAIDHSVCQDIVNYGQNNVIKGVNKYPKSFGISFHSCLLPSNHAIHNLLSYVWEEAVNYLDIDISFIEPYELKRYTVNDFFGKHSDSYYSLDNKLDRKLTLSLQLSDINDYDNGEFVVLGKKIKLNKGSVLCFPSYFPHEISRISNGTRWALIGWAWGNNWR